MAYLLILTKIGLPDDYFQCSETQGAVGVHFKAFINALEESGQAVTFEVTTEPGEIKPAEPRRRGPDKNPRKPVLSVVTPVPDDEPA